MTAGWSPWDDTLVTDYHATTDALIARVLQFCDSLEFVFEQRLYECFSGWPNRRTPREHFPLASAKSHDLIQKKTINL